MDIDDIMNMLGAAMKGEQEVNTIYTTDYDCSCGTKCNLVVETSKDDSITEVVLAVTSCHGTSDIILNNEQTMALINALMAHVSKGNNGKNKLQ